MNAMTCRHWWLRILPGHDERVGLTATLAIRSRYGWLGRALTLEPGRAMESSRPEYRGSVRLDDRSGMYVTFTIRDAIS